MPTNQYKIFISRYLKQCLILFSICFISPIYSQQKEIDSLRKELSFNKEDTLGIIGFNRLGFLYHTSKPDSTLFFAQKALKLSKEIDYPKGEARALSVLSNAFYSTGNYSKALELQLSALKKYESIHDLQGISNTTGNIGNIQGALGNFSEALNYNFKTLKLKQKLGDTRGVGIALANIGQVHLIQSQLDSARYYVLQSYDIALRERDSYRKRIMSIRLASIYTEMGEKTMALEYFKSAFDKSNPDIFTLNASLGLAEFYKSKNISDSTLYFAHYAYDNAKKEGLTDIVNASSTFLASYYKENHQFEEAYTFLEVSLSARDSLYSLEKRNKTQSLYLEELARQQEKEEAQLALLQKQKTNLQYLAIIGCIFIFILVFLLLSRSIRVSEKWLSYLGIFILLLVFEFINLYLASKIALAVNFSAIYTLLIMVLMLLS